MAKTDRSTDRAYRVSKAAFRAECEAADAPCWLCTQAIDYQAAPDEYANDSRYELDHYFPVSTHKDLETDPANFRPSHAGCNRERGNEAPAPPIGIPSRDWLGAA